MQEKIINMMAEYEDDYEILKITKTKLKDTVKSFLIQEGTSKECIDIILKQFTVDQCIKFISDMGEVNARDWLMILQENEIIVEI